MFLPLQVAKTPRPGQSTPKGRKELGGPGGVQKSTFFRTFFETPFWALFFRFGAALGASWDPIWAPTCTQNSTKMGSKTETFFGTRFEDCDMFWSSLEPLLESAWLPVNLQWNDWGSGSEASRGESNRSSGSGQLVGNQSPRSDN